MAKSNQYSEEFYKAVELNLIWQNIKTGNWCRKCKNCNNILEYKGKSSRTNAFKQLNALTCRFCVTRRFVRILANKEGKVLGSICVYKAKNIEILSKI
jgi:hypothetical protein